MGVSNQGIHGNWKNKVGNVVGHIRQGRTILTVYQPDVANPRTENQLRVRSRFNLLVKFFAGSMSILRAGLQSSVQKGTAFSEAVKINNADGVTGTYPSFAINYAKIQLSKGGLAQPYGMTASYESGTIDFIWTDNSGIGNAKAKDKIVIAAYNETKQQWIYDLGASTRSARSASLDVPSMWTGDKVVVYTFCTSVDGLTSDSQYMGEFTL